MPNYGDPNYWIDRYKEQQETTFDWLEDYQTLKPLIDGLKLPETPEIINIGCGNAEFSEHMYDDGYTQITNIDIADNVVDYMKERNLNRKKMTCKYLVLVFIYLCIIFLFSYLFYTHPVEEMDVRNLKYKTGSFDLAIDKSTIDAILCGENSFINVAIMTKEIQRVLKEGGIYMIISYGQPENRIFHLEREHLNFEISMFTIKKESDDFVDDLSNAKEKMHYVYICKKKEGADEVSDENFPKVFYELEKQEMMEEELMYDDEFQNIDEQDYYNDNEIVENTGKDNISNTNNYIGKDTDQVNNIEVNNLNPNNNSNNYSNSNMNSQERLDKLDTMEKVGKKNKLVSLDHQSHHNNLSNHHLNTSKDNNSNNNNSNVSNTSNTPKNKNIVVNSIKNKNVNANMNINKIMNINKNSLTNNSLNLINSNNK